MWCTLPESVKDCWIEAGKTINTYDEFAKNIPNKVCTIFLYIICIYENIYFVHFRLLSLIQTLQMAA